MSEKNRSKQVQKQHKLLEDFVKELLKEELKEEFNRMNPRVIAYDDGKTVDVFIMVNDKWITERRERLLEALVVVRNSVLDQNPEKRGFIWLCRKEEWLKLICRR
jgi:hypothetical protein